MKKTLLVAALAAGFAGVAHAESSVTLYGIVDAGVGVTKQTLKVDGVKVSSNRQVGARSGVKNGNRWGLKGSEDLGNGTSAIFELESGFNIANGRAGQNGGVFSRHAIIGLTGESWGTFTIGRQYTAADDYMGSFDPFGTAYLQAAATSTFGDSIGARKDAVIKYMSPDFAGFQFSASVTTNNEKTTREETTTQQVADLTTGIVRTVETTGPLQTTKTKQNGFGLGFKYQIGGFDLGASFDYENNSTTVNGVRTADRKTKAWTVGASYDFDVVKAYLMYGQQRDGFVSGGVDNESLVIEMLRGGTFDTKGLRVQSWLAGLSAPVGESGKAMFSYQGRRIKHDSLTGTANFYGQAVNSARIDTHIWSLGYTQSLSKRTSVYAVASYGYSKGKDSANSRTKLKGTEVVLGFNHRF